MLWYSCLQDNTSLSRCNLCRHDIHCGRKWRRKLRQHWKHNMPPKYPQYASHCVNIRLALQICGLHFDSMKGMKFFQLPTTAWLEIPVSDLTTRPLRSGPQPRRNQQNNRLRSMEQNKGKPEALSSVAE